MRGGHAASTQGKQPPVAVVIRMAVLCLPEVGSDVLLTLSSREQVPEAAADVAAADFAQALRSFAVHDWKLFGG